MSKKQKQQSTSETSTTEESSHHSDVELNKRKSSESISSEKQRKMKKGEPVARKVKNADLQPNKQSRHWLQFFPVPFIAMVMGIGGLALVFKKYATLFDISDTYYLTILYIAIGTFVIITLIYIAKIIKFKKAVIAEFNHPIRLNFFPAFNISILLFSIAFIPDHETVAEVLMWIGVVGQIPLTMFTLRKWMMLPFRREIFNPTAIIPIVSLLLVAVPMGKLRYVEGAWLFLSFGLFWWILMIVSLFVRIMWEEKLPKKFLPALYITIAPPAIGLIAYQAIQHDWTDISRLLFGITVADFAVLLALSFDIFQMHPCTTYLAYTFPMDALAISFLEFHAYYDSTVSKIFAYIFAYLALATVVFVLLILFSLIIRRIIFIPEKEKIKSWKEYFQKKK
ncbi:tellurite resistance protein teha [Anaeramoeba flamelloides]|uniref:Tellurite resistance protein teha n=1 Tax=Anaeramoeba flamelloides TaxID=1746091 RepID=A0ABQ8Y1X2_9EUKA|nr:tellurite resistance protein teha [Anaeramoeba flamelloides]